MMFVKRLKHRRQSVHVSYYYKESETWWRKKYRPWATETGNFVVTIQGESTLSNDGLAQILAWVTPNSRSYLSTLQRISMLLQPHTSVSPCSQTHMHAILVLSCIKLRWVLPFLTRNPDTQYFLKLVTSLKILRSHIVLWVTFCYLAAFSLSLCSFPKLILPVTQPFMSNSLVSLINSEKI